MNLTDWARANGINKYTAYRWFNAGTLPVPAVRINSRPILVQVPSPAVATRVALYARVSSHDQKDDLVGQLARLDSHATSRGFEVVNRVGEVGSGMNGHRAKLLRLLGDADVGAIVVEHRERLGRMNTELVEAALGAQ